MMPVNLIFLAAVVASAIVSFGLQAMALRWGMRWDVMPSAKHFRK
jgi:hypothetical protein